MEGLVVGDTDTAKLYGKIDLNILLDDALEFKYPLPLLLLAVCWLLLRQRPCRASRIAIGLE